MSELASKIQARILALRIVSTGTRFARQDSAIVLLICLIGVVGLLKPAFLTYSNFANVLTQAAALGIVTCGITWVLIGGSFDLSVGSTLSLVSVVLATLLTDGISTWLAVLIALAVGVAAGLTNGILIGVWRANPVIVTLGTMSVFQGLALLVTGGQFLYPPARPDFLAIGQRHVLQIGIPGLIFIGFGLIMHLLLRQTVFGRRVYAVGSSFGASTVAGIRVTVYRAGLFVVAGFATALAAVVVTARTDSASPFVGQGFEFDAITAAVIGGTSLFGGVGSVLRGGVLGVCVLALLENAQTLLGVSIDVQYVTKGVVLAGIVAIDYNRARHQ